MYCTYRTGCRAGASSLSLGRKPPSAVPLCRAWFPSCPSSRTVQREVVPKHAAVRHLEDVKDQLVPLVEQQLRQGGLDTQPSSTLGPLAH